MKIETADRMLKKGLGKTALAHAYWGAAFLVVAFPATYFYGRHVSHNAVDWEPIQKAFQERAVQPLPSQAPPPEILDVLMPFGQAVPEASASAGGRPFWMVSYPMDSFVDEDEALEALQREWQSLGLAPKREGKSVKATSDALDAMLVGSVQEGGLRIYAWSGTTTPEGDEEFNSASFKMLGLPDPPVGAEVLAVSNPGAGSVLSFKVHELQTNALLGYGQRLLGRGWTVVPIPAEIVARSKTPMRMFRDTNGRHLTVQAGADDDGGTILSLVVF